MNERADCRNERLCARPRREQYRERQRTELADGGVRQHTRGRAWSPGNWGEGAAAKKRAAEKIRRPENLQRIGESIKVGSDDLAAFVYAQLEGSTILFESGFIDCPAIESSLVDIFNR